MSFIPSDNTSLHHCDLLSDSAHGTNSNFIHCKVNPGHDKFLPVTEFGKNHLPSKYQTDAHLDRIKNVINRTVKIRVSTTSINRPNTFPESHTPYPFSDCKGSNVFSRCGTGYLECFVNSYKGQPCPCPDCKKSNHQQMQFWKFIVSTATHVIFDGVEAMDTVIEFFYDSENKEGVESLYGDGVFGNDLGRYRTDVCGMICVTHDMELANRLKHLCNYKVPVECFDFDLGFLVSHPHGVSKRITLGNIHRRHFIKDTISLPVRLKKGDIFNILPYNENQENIHNCHHKNVTKSSNRPHNQIVSLSKCTTTDWSPEIEHNAMNSQKSISPLSPCKYDIDIFHSCKKSDDLFPLPYDMTVVSSPDSELPPYHEIEIDVDRKLWNSFPADMETITQERRAVSVPTETKFLLSGLDSFSSCNNSLYVTYDMASCPGSSGARLVDSKYPYGVSCHFGCCEGKGRSGLTREYNCLSIVI